MKTMSSSTERSRKFREKLKNDEKRWEAYRKKDRERKTKQAQGRVSLSEKEKAFSHFLKTFIKINDE